MQNQSMNHNDQNIMTLTGKGQVTAIPDIAVLRFGVETTGENLTAIQSENARISQAILQAIKQLGITDIKTAMFTINKVYDYVDNRQIDKGYSVRNVLEVRMRNMDQVGRVIDVAVANGANIVDLIEFEVSEPDIYYLQALNLAVEDAKQKAFSIAETLDIIVDAVPRRVIENSTSPIIPRNVALREGAFATPIEPGTKQIEAMVTLEFEYYKI
jgi:uncharacterized protein YggE